MRLTGNEGTDRAANRGIPTRTNRRVRRGVVQIARVAANRAALLARPVMASTVYRWYEGRLLATVLSRPMPGHIAMILDGNRRFARQLGLKNVTDGHRFGASKVTEVIRWCDQLEIDTVTLWGLSTDNFKRPPEELNDLFAILQQQLRKLRTDQAGTGRRRVRVLGRLELLPAEVQDDLRALEEQTAADGPRALNIALAYGGRDEIVDAFRNMLVDRAERGHTLQQIAEAIRPEDLRPFLYAGPESPDPDLIIRTSGELRLSGFLLWQSTNSELYFCDPYWPAFRKIDLLRAIRSYQQRQRRFGQ